MSLAWSCFAPSSEPDFWSHLIPHTAHHLFSILLYHRVSRKLVYAAYWHVNHQSPSFSARELSSFSAQESSLFSAPKFLFFRRRVALLPELRAILLLSTQECPLAWFKSCSISSTQDFHLSDPPVPSYPSKRGTHFSDTGLPSSSSHQSRLACLKRHPVYQLRISTFSSSPVPSLSLWSCQRWPTINMTPTTTSTKNKLTLIHWQAWPLSRRWLHIVSRIALKARSGLLNWPMWLAHQGLSVYVHYGRMDSMSGGSHRWPSGK